MVINKEEAKKWPKERIHEELRDLRRRIDEYNNYIDGSLEVERGLEEEERERLARNPYARERVFDASYERDSLRSAILIEEGEIEFLKSLLGGNLNLSNTAIRKTVPSPENSRQDTYLRSKDRVVYVSPQTRAPHGRRGVGR